MALNIDELAAEAMQLPFGDKVILVDNLVESLDLTGPSDLQRLWAAEALKRREEVRTGLVEPIDGSKVIAEARCRVGR